MMNILALGLVLTSLVTGSIWSPSPPPSEVIVKEGHRVVTVEYEKEADGHTKVLISPHDHTSSTDKTSQHASDEAEGKSSGPRELVCDAFGKCKHKIAQAIGKTKDMVSEKAHKAHDMEEHVRDATTGALGKAKDTVHHYEDGAKKAAKDVYEKGRDLGPEARDKVSEKVKGAEEKAKSHMHIGESLGKAKDSVTHGIGKATKVAGDVVGLMKDGVVKQAENFDVVDSPKRMGEDIQRNVTGKIEEGAEHVIEKTKETARKMEEKTFREIVTKLKEVTYDVIWYMLSVAKLDAVAGLIHMLGFSTAYGMSVWVTFISSYILGRYLPRQQFGMLQSRIYPVYFKAMAYSVSATLLGHLATQRKQIFSSSGEMFQGFSLLSALLMVLTNMIWLEPKATKLMYERMKIEKEEGRGIAVAAKEGIPDDGSATVARPSGNVAAERQDVLRLNERLKRLNTYSSAFNVLTFVGLTWHMAYMGQRLQATR